MKIKINGVVRDVSGSAATYKQSRLSNTRMLRALTWPAVERDQLHRFTEPLDKHGIPWRALVVYETTPDGEKVRTSLVELWAEPPLRTLVDERMYRRG